MDHTMDTTSGLCAGRSFLTDMPREIIDAIISYLGRGRDVASCCTALGESASFAMLRHVRTKPLAWLRAGAPLAVVEALLAKAAPHGWVSFEWAKAAAGGGRLDVLVRLHALVDLGFDEWAYVGRERRRLIFERMRSLLKAAVVGRGGSDVIDYILRVYDGPRFRSRRLFNSGMLIRLSRHAINHRSDAVDVLEALHSHDKKGKCGCTKKLAYDAARTDRPDVLAWMAEHGCCAIADAVQTTCRTVVEYITRRGRNGLFTTTRRHTYPWSEEYDDIALVAVRAKAASAVAWFGPKTDRRRIVDAICRLDDSTCQERINLIMGGSLAKTALTMFLQALVALIKCRCLVWMTTPWRLILLGTMAACAASKCAKGCRRPDPMPSTSAEPEPPKAF
ncbi:hypothetical protein pqer_cds_850 [Pandoravirus quercus]|uniref:F-box incomplete domain containing protein n=2 Tax=Pandoravirus TaxID=2060084 RepID=A0A2U7UA52_9VIRU|nr:hypothetical protein pqer_cds_850 [Pandoravirus quercus]AVK75272.1 hypothetical protein pqer_cds_850 [Pandoravirus quercus]QBZ81445.1 hypothetical protein pclt_cds_858 [Pandoravirus celtis]